MFINGAGALNDAMGRLTGIDPNIAEQLRGVYVEVAYRVLPGQRRRTTRRCSCATRTSTRSSRCPRGPCQLPQFDRDAWVVGATYWVDPDVAIKFDYSHVRNQSDDRAAAALVQRRSGMVVLKHD